MKHKHTVMMTFPASKWKEYGQYCLPSADANWPEGQKVIAMIEDPENIPYTPSDRVEIIDYNQSPIRERVNEFQKRNPDRDMYNMGTTGNIAIQAFKFAHKALAQLHILENTTEGYVWYIDADTKILQKLTTEFLDSLASTGAYLGCTPRWWKPNGYTETGLMMWNTEDLAHKEWCKLYASCYDEDKIFEIGSPGKNLPFELPDGWHDCVSFDYATKTLLKNGSIKMVDFGYGVRSSHPLVSGPLGRYFDHMKGNRKFVGESKERVRVHGK